MSKIPTTDNKKLTKKIIVTRRSLGIIGSQKKCSVTPKQSSTNDQNECGFKAASSITKTKLNSELTPKSTGAVPKSSSTITKTKSTTLNSTGAIPKIMKSTATTSKTAPGKAVPPKKLENNSKPRKGPVSVNKKTEATLPKVSKPIPQKFAPYDYKGKFNALKEKYITMKTANLGMTDEIKYLRKDLEDYMQVKLRKDFLEENYKELKIKFDDLQNNYQDINKAHNALLQKYSTIVEKYEARSKQYKIVCEDINTTKQILRETQTELETCKIDLSSSHDIRKKLHNTIQDLKGKIRVFCRCRPQKPDENEKSLCTINFLDEKTLSVLKSREANRTPIDSVQDFSFDRVFPPVSSQDEIFEDLSQLVQSVLDGYNVCVFAYGQTGSGKTYTMMGDGTEEGQGMIPKSIDLLFKKIKELEHSGWKFTVETSMLEIYNENIKDLLNINSTKTLEIKFNQGKGTTVRNLTVKIVENESELQSLMINANKNRAIAATNFNEHSSRSHAVTKIILNGTNSYSNVVHSSSLNLVDLAGSECAKNSERLEETKCINKSLANLGNVMLALHNKNSHIPYRNSKLTYLLQPCLDGDSKTLMIVTISPFLENYNETISSLRFALKVKEVKVCAKRNRTCISID